MFPPLDKSSYLKCQALKQFFKKRGCSIAGALSFGLLHVFFSFLQHLYGFSLTFWIAFHRQLVRLLMLIMLKIINRQLL